jgi:citrate lyase subunit beta / citryl-CoA lyase
VESAGDVHWVRERAADTPLICAIETARGILPRRRSHRCQAHDIYRWVASTYVVTLGPAGRATLQTLCAHSHLIVASRAAGIDPPIDSVYAKLHDDEGLRAETEFARSLGFFGKSAIHPKQLPTLHAVFTPSADDLTWAQTVLDAFDTAGGEAIRLPDGEFVDLPVVDRARRLIELAGRLPVTVPVRRSRHVVDKSSPSLTGESSALEMKPRAGLSAMRSANSSSG